MNHEIDAIIAKLGLTPHPTEGGYFSETYRSDQSINQNALHEDYNGPRATSTAIYYLLTPDTVSAMHRLCSDEIFHFYLGDTVEQLLLYPNGSGEIIELGSNVLANQRLQSLVPRNIWQGARLKAGGTFALLGCTVAPGFDFVDYIHGDRANLQSQYPDHKDMISALTPTDPVIRD